tara:strand:+ start:329 stop:508 length:180 start_codon:yes stop_codon:yes gene_type:complete
MIEHFFQCPYCWEEISMLLDGSLSQIEYIEDCEVCCNPISISFQQEEESIVSFSAQAMD